MFDFVVFRRTDRQRIVDLGLLAETLLFYQKMHIVFDPGSLVEFVRSIGLPQLIELLSREGITGSFQRDITAVVSNSTGGISLHNCAIMRMSGNQEKKHLNDREYVETILVRELGKSAVTNKLIRDFIKRIVFAPLPLRGKGTDDILGAAASDLKDQSFLTEAIERILSNSVPGLKLPSGWSFRVHFVGTNYGDQPQFVVETNLNYEELNTKYHENIPPSHSSLSSAHLVALVIGAREAEYISSKHMSELIIDPTTSDIMKLRYLELFKKRDRQCTEIDLFQNLIFQESRAIRDAVNSGEKSFSEFLQLLDRASKFKKFLALQNPEHSLLESYYSELRKESWVDRLPSKAIRIVLATGLGAVAEALFPTGGVSTLMGAGYGAFDSLLLDKLLKGWRPNQFIDDQLIPFVSGRR